MRLGRIGAGLALLMLASVAAGCGDGLPAPQAQGEVAGPVTRPRVAAFAREVQLRAGDLPGAIVSGSEENAADESLAEGLVDCGGDVTVPEVVASFQAPTFLYGKGREVAVFSSGIGAVPTPFQAKTPVEQLNSPGTFGCLQSVIPSALENGDFWEGGAIRDVRVSRLTAPLPPTQYAYGFRLSTKAVAEGQRLPLFIDIIGFAFGPAEVRLVAVGSPTPVNQTIEAGLMETLYSRAVSTGF